MALSKMVLIARDRPEGLPEEVVVISPDDLGEAAMAELEAMTGDALPEPEGEAMDEGSAPQAESDVHDEEGEGLEEEVEESPEVQAAEAEAGTEMHQAPELKAMADEQMATLLADEDLVAKIADAIPAAKDAAKTFAKAVADAEKVLEKLSALDDDETDKALKLSEEFLGHYEAAVAACAEAKALVPDITGSRIAATPSPDTEEEPVEEGGGGGVMGLAGWAARAGA